MKFEWLIDDDNDSRITVGLNGLKYCGILREDDNYGGYIALFTINKQGVLAYYHVHFYWGGTRVSCIRHVRGSNEQGTNIVRCKREDGGTFSRLAHACRVQGFPNHRELMLKFKEAIREVKRQRNNELSNV